MAYVFTPPTYDLKPVNQGRLASFFPVTHGYAVVKNGSTYSQTTVIDQLTADTADAVYLGGHKYYITAAEAAALNAAGYTTTTE